MSRPSSYGRAPPTTRAERAGWPDPLARGVGRVPVTVRTKLLAAFAGIAALFIGVGVLGLHVLGQTNSRIESLGTLQLRAATYQSLQTQAETLRQLLGMRTADDRNWSTYLVGPRLDIGGRSGRTRLDLAISATLLQLGPATNERRFGFVPPPEDEALLERIRADHRRFSIALRHLTALDRTGPPSKRSSPYLGKAIEADNDLSAVADRLAATTRAQTNALIAQSRSSYSGSRDLLVALGAASILLALLLGLVLSLSVVTPIRRTEARLAEIAAGDFSQHVDVPNRDELGALAANLNRMNDELRRLYEELETASRHKSEFLANVSHELRTPLNAIIGFSELVQQQRVGALNELQVAYMDDVVGAGRHLLALINDVLDLSKVEAGKMELDLSDVSLREALETGVTMHAGRTSREGVLVRLHLDPDEIVVRADERKLRQVVFNLLSNAVKFTPAGGSVDIAAQLSDGVVEVAVSDTGPGIATRDQELIFEEFGQARVESGDRPEGTGLGLPLSRRLIELHGGRLWVESAEGSGSTFRFTLPVTQPA